MSGFFLCFSGLIVGVIIKFIYASQTAGTPPDTGKGVWAVLVNNTNQSYTSDDAPASVYINLTDPNNSSLSQTRVYNLTEQGTDNKPEPMLERAVRNDLLSILC